MSLMTSLSIDIILFVRGFVKTFRKSSLETSPPSEIPEQRQNGGRGRAGGTNWDLLPSTYTTYHSSNVAKTRVRKKERGWGTHLPLSVS